MNKATSQSPRGREAIDNRRAQTLGVNKLKNAMKTTSLQCASLLWVLAVPLAVHSQTNDTGRWYYAIENVATRAVVRRGTSTGNALKATDFILAPNTRYRAWLFETATDEVGYQDFTTPE